MDQAAPAPRKANLGDAMILIVALAVGLAIAGRTLSSMGTWFGMINPSSRSDPLIWWWAVTRKTGPQFRIVQGCVELLFCLMAPLTPALVVARIRRPRPAFRLLVRQPGFVACAALCLSTLIEVDLRFLQLATIPPLFQIASPGAAVLLPWLVLLATGRWQPEASWVDRAGRFAGAFWVVMPWWLLWVAS